MPRLSIDPVEESVRTAAIHQRSREKKRAITIGPCLNPDERNAAEFDLLYYAKRYHAPKLDLGLCRNHIRLFKLTERAFLDDGQFLVADAEPRGTGKSTICRIAVEWAVLYGHCIWPILIEADDTAFKKQMEAFHITFRTSELLRDDFPESAGVFFNMPTRKSAPYLTLDGEECYAVFKTDAIVIPTNPKTIEVGSAGSVISGGGITGSVRGAQYTLPDGRVIRPDAFLVNDFQTRESANSQKQIKDRLSIIDADLLGMAGPGKPMRGALTGTVIARDDGMDRLLGPDYPQWRSIRGKWLLKWPTNRELWSQYGIVLRRVLSDLSVVSTDEDLTNEFDMDELIKQLDEMLNADDFKEVNEFYERNRETLYGLGWIKYGLDHGAVVYWNERIDKPYLTSLQTFMSRYELSPESTMAECQNEPLDDTAAADVSYATRIQILEKITPLRHMQVPDDAVCLTSFIDVQNEVLVGGVMATCQGYRRYFVDYRTFPDQKSTYWSRRSIKRKLTKLWGSQSECWYEGLIAFTEQIEAAEYYRRNGQRIHLDIGMIDARDGDAQDTVFKFCVDYGRGVWFPSYGIYVGANTNSLNHGSEAKAWQGRHRDWGPNWNRKNDASRGHDHINFDANYFKTTVHAGILTPEVDPMSLQLYDGNHDLVAAHLRGEYPIKTEGRGRECTEWKARPNEDNELLDVISGCSVGASVSKVVIPGTELMVRRKRKGRARMRTA